MKPLLLCLCLSLALAGCGRPALAGESPPRLPAPSPSAVSPPATASPTATGTPTPSPTAAATATPTLTATPTVEASPTWEYHTAGRVDAPILLYHHIDTPEKPSPYFVSPEEFRLQMESLRDWGYTPITVTLLAEVLVAGGRLPERPVVITFDDGFRDVYWNAFPVMEALGFVGVSYLISSQVDSGPYLRAADLQEMTGAGWEFGNHSASHRSLIEGYSADLVQAEIVQSRLDLEALLGLPVRTFSYPYGLASQALREKLAELGYLAAVGVGATWVHRAKSVFFLGRSEVRRGCDLACFAALLPWTGTATPTVNP